MNMKMIEYIRCWYDVDKLGILFFVYRNENWLIKKFFGKYFIVCN